MGDIVDTANDYAADFLSDSEKAVRGLVPEERPELDEEVECSDCGVILDPRRAKLGYDICTICSDWQDKHNKQYNRRSSRSYEYDE